MQIGLPPAKVRDVVKALGKLGFRLERIQGNHLIFKHSDGRITVVPRHGNQEIGGGLLRKIAWDLGLIPEEFAKLIEE